MEGILLPFLSKSQLLERIMVVTDQIMLLGLMVIHMRVYVALRAAIMPKSKNIHKIPILTPKVTQKVSKHRFSGSRNPFLALETMFDKENTLKGAF